MKKLNLVIWIAILATMQSCFKDIGNYTYQEINSFTISGIADNYLVRSRLDTIRILPDLEMTQSEVDSQRYDYRWILRYSIPTMDSFEDTISRSVQLTYPVDLAERDYKLVFQIYDKETKVVWEKSSFIQVKSANTRGIMLIGEDENQHAEVDMISMVFDTTVIRGLLSSSGLPPMRDPLAIQHSGGSRSGIMKLWVFTSDGSYYLDRTSFKGNPADNFAKITYTNLPLTHEDLTPVLMAPQINNITGTVADASARILVTKTGYIFGGVVGQNGGDVYVSPINVDVNNPKEILPAAPFLFYPIQQMTNMLWYDTSRDRFMNIPTFFSVTSSQTLVDQPGDIFPWNQAGTGRKLIYGENTNNTDAGGTKGNSFALMKDPQNNYSLYKFYASGAKPLKLGMYPIKSIARDFNRASMYAFAPYRSLLFYVVDNKLYAYDYNPGSEKLYELEVTTGNDAITMIKFDTQINPTSNSIYIATYNPINKGTLQRFTLGTDPNTVELAPIVKDKWSNLVKIKNMAWRAVN